VEPTHKFNVGNGRTIITASISKAGNDLTIKFEPCLKTAGKTCGARLVDIRETAIEVAFNLAAQFLGLNSYDYLRIKKSTDSEITVCLKEKYFLP